MSEYNVPENPITPASASVPIGALAQKTMGRQPRSREASSREAMSRANDVDLAHFEKIFEMEQRGKTFMPPEATPPGYTGMWVRTAVQGKTNYGNVESRMRLGWIPPSSDKFPKVGFVNVYGDITDDRSTMNVQG